MSARTDDNYLNFVAHASDVDSTFFRLVNHTFYVETGEMLLACNETTFSHTTSALRTRGETERLIKRTATEFNDLIDRILSWL